MQRLRAALTPKKRDADGKHLDALDGVRVLFVFLVGWFHIWQQSWLSPEVMLFSQKISLDFLPRTGYMLVDGMLLLSGLLLYYPVAMSGRQPEPLAFYKKRLIRIVPSYLLSILVMLLFVALPQGRYTSFSAGAKDVLAHLTFTHTFFSFSYTFTPLNGALWTLAIEMQFYLLFPLLSRAFKARPVLTWCGLTAAAFAYRTYAAAQPDTTMLVNQLPAFLDVYANGFVAASVIAALKKRFQDQQRVEKVFFTVGAALCLCLLVGLLKEQANSSGYEGIRLGQLARRFSLSVLLSMLMVCVCFSLSGVRFLLGNRVMRFLSGVSFQFYIWHQVLAVQLKSWGFPPAESAEPWRMNERAWQTPYTLACFALALLLSVAVTYLFEKPVTRLFNKQKRARDIPASMA